METRVNCFTSYVDYFVRTVSGARVLQNDPQQSIVATGSISRLAKLAPGLPPIASPRWWTMHSSRAVRPHLRRVVTISNVLDAKADSGHIEA